LGNVIRILFFVSLIVVAYMMIRHPRAIRHAGKRIQLVAFVYVVAIVISALFRLSPWGS